MGASDVTWGNQSDFKQLPLESQKAQYNFYAAVLPNTSKQSLM